MPPSPQSTPPSAPSPPDDCLPCERSSRRRRHPRRGPWTTDHGPRTTDNIPVWSYWTGPRPAWIEICQDTLRRNSPTAIILDDTVWTTLYDGEIPAADILRQLPNVRSDILRVWLMLRYGGIWVDADCIVWRDLRPIAAHLRGRRTWVCYRAAHTRHLCSGLIASTPGSPIAVEYWRRIVAALQPGVVLPPLAVGPTEMMAAAIAAAGWRDVHLLDGRTVQPISWRRASRLRRPGTFTPRPDAWTLMLGHGQLRHVGHWDRDRILQSDLLIASLFRRALDVRRPLSVVSGQLQNATDNGQRTTDNVPIWTYWTGPQPDWIGLCLATLRLNSPTATILDDTVWDTLYDGQIPVRWIRRQLPAVQADILRAWLLHTRGGIWVDADCIVFRDLRSIAQPLSQADYVTYRLERPTAQTNALLAATPDSLIAARYWELIVQRCAGAGRRLRRTALGPRLLSQAILAAPDRCHYLPPALVHPVHFRRRRQFLRPRKRPRLIPPDAWCCMLVHRALGPLHAARRDQILTSHTLIARIFRRAVGLPASDNRVTASRVN